MCEDEGSRDPLLSLQHMHLVHERLSASQVSLLTLGFLCEPFLLLSWHLYTLPLSPFEIRDKYKLEVLTSPPPQKAKLVWPPKFQSKLLKPRLAVHKACQVCLVLVPTVLIQASWIKVPPSQPAPLLHASKLTGMNPHKGKPGQVQTHFSTNLSAG